LRHDTLERKQKESTTKSMAKVKISLLVYWLLSLCTTSLISAQAELCSICGDGQILSNSNAIIPSGIISFLPTSDISCLQAEMQSMEWNIGQCAFVRMKTNASTICGCAYPPTSTTSCGICRKGEIISNANSIIPMGTISFITEDVSCQQAEIDAETKWEVDQCSIVKQTNATTICGCGLNPRPTLRGSVWGLNDTMPSSDTTQRRRGRSRNIFQK
jgi:hypothetical protein